MNGNRFASLLFLHNRIGFFKSGSTAAATDRSQAPAADLTA
jgi:hypothetical protein